MGTSYAAKTRPALARSASDAVTTTAIRRVHAGNYGVYGVRKMHAELNRQGRRVARCTVHRLMRLAALRGVSSDSVGDGCVDHAFGRSRSSGP